MTDPAWLTVALGEVDYREGPNNDNKYGKALGLNYVPWCDLFVAFCCRKSKHPLPSMQPGMTTGAASVWYSMRWAQENGLWIRSWEAKPGAQIVYGWDGPGSSPARMHTGLVVKSGAQGSTGQTVEGNRGDAVGRFTFTVGADQVLGCIDLPKLLLGRDKITVSKPRPDPQPTPPDHPTHTGPPSVPRVAVLHADLGELPGKAARALKAETDRLHVTIAAPDRVTPRQRRQVKRAIRLLRKSLRTT